jgi:hypothetical protein
MLIKTSYGSGSSRNSKGNYKCLKCGHRFIRQESSGWTANPFNKKYMMGDIKGLEDECSLKLTKRLKYKKCPKCDTICKNLDLRAELYMYIKQFFKDYPEIYEEFWKIRSLSKLKKQKALIGIANKVYDLDNQKGNKFWEEG